MERVVLITKSSFHLWNKITIYSYQNKRSLYSQSKLSLVITLISISYFKKLIHAININSIELTKEPLRRPFSWKP